MERRGSPIPREQRRFQDRLPEDFLHPDLNPYLKLHRGWGRPVLTADEAAECRGGWHEEFGREEGRKVLAGRALRVDLAPEEMLPDDTRLWAALQNVGGGTWSGCVYDVDAIVRTLEAGARALHESQ